MSPGGAEHDERRGRVAVLGLGAMGSRIAGRLLEAGQEVIVWNRTRAKVEPLVSAGATASDTPGDAAERAVVVITMLRDPLALRSVTEGPGGVFSHIASGSTIIEMSTVGPAAISRLASLVPSGVGVLDAPVLGSLSEAESGSLAIFVGGAMALFSRWSALLSLLGSPIHLGPLGCGATAKLMANTTLFSTLGTVGEALALADGLGLSREAAFAVLAKTSVAAQAERRRAAIESGEYPLHFSLSLARKDADLIGEAAKIAGVDLRLAEAARSWLETAEIEGGGDRDYSAVLETILRDGENRDRASSGSSEPTE